MQRLFILLYFYGMKYTLFVLIAGLLITACNNNNSDKTKNDAVAPNPEQSFFPVPDYIGGQLKIIDSLQLPISKSVTINNNIKLSVATDQELRELAANFRQPDISSPSLKKLYRETSIADQSVPSVTLIYTATDTSLEIQKINV